MGEPSFEVTALNRVRQQRERGHYDRETVYAILDEGIVAHVAFVDDGRPIVIPMAYARDGERILLHGGRKSRLVAVAGGHPVSLGVTIVDGLVAARSLFESSMNYRAVVVHGRATEVLDEGERLRALECIAEHLLPGRAPELRAADPGELRATAVLEVTIETASAKMRAGPAADGEEERSPRVWSGVVPVRIVYDSPVPDATVPADVGVPASLLRLHEAHGA